LKAKPGSVDRFGEGREKQNRRRKRRNSQRGHRGKFCQSPKKKVSEGQTVFPGATKPREKGRSRKHSWSGELAAKKEKTPGEKMDKRLYKKKKWKRTHHLRIPDKHPVRI